MPENILPAFFLFYIYMCFNKFVEYTVILKYLFSFLMKINTFENIFIIDKIIFYYFYKP